MPPLRGSVGWLGRRVGPRAAQALTRLAIECRPSGAPEGTSGSIPQVALVVFDFVDLEELDELVLKVCIAMVFLLAGEIVLHGVQMGIARGEGTVTVLPG